MVAETIASNPQMFLFMSTGIMMWYCRPYCNFVDRVVQAPTHPWPSAFSSRIESPDEDEIPPTNITPFPSGEVAIAPPDNVYGNSGPVDKWIDY